jgi:hypothetical protein
VGAFGEMEKSPTTVGFTVSEIVMVCSRVPEVPVILTGNDPVVAVELAVNVTVLVDVVGLVPKLTVTPA